MKVIQERSLKIHESLASKPPEAPIVPIKPLRDNAYVSNHKSIIAIVRSNDRSTAVQEALKLLGGLDPVLKELKGTILLKPNCNTDDPFPASTHPEMVRLVSELLISQKVEPNNIIIGDMGGKVRGLPTRWTMKNIGLTKVANDLGLRLNFFEEEDWVTVSHPEMHHWPKGVRIPRCLYEAERVMSLPALKTHLSATFTLSLKNGVGFIDALSRDLLHNGEAQEEKTAYFGGVEVPVYGETLNEKTAELNLAYTADLIILDGIKCFTTGGPFEGKLAQPGVVIAGGDRVAVDAIGVSLLKQLGAEGIYDHPIRDHKQLIWSEKIGLGNLEKNKIEIRASNLEEDPEFSEMLKTIKKDLSS